MNWFDFTENNKNNNAILYIVVEGTIVLLKT